MRRAVRASPEAREELVATCSTELLFVDNESGMMRGSGVRSKVW